MYVLKTLLCSQFDKVQESFLALEQQTSTFQAHLEGLGKESQEGPAGPLAQADGASSCSGSPQIHRERTQEHRNSESGSSSVSSTDVTDIEAEKETLSLCERSALHFSSTIGRLRKSGRRK